MVFFTAIIIIVIFYFLKENGLIFTVIIALIGEFINILLIQSQTKSIKEDLKVKQKNEIKSYLSRITDLELAINDLNSLQKTNVIKICEANAKIEDLERELEGASSTDINQADPICRENNTTHLSAESRQIKADSKKYSDLDHLPSGSNRKKLPI